MVHSMHSCNITTILASIAAVAAGRQQQHLHLRTLQEQLPPLARGGYGIVMNAGSSHTEMKTLYWDAASPLDAPIEVGKSIKMKPGISSFKDDLSKVSDMLPLLEQARSNLDEVGVDWAEVPLFLGATGGMRLLPTSNRVAIMASIRPYFRENGFRVDNDDWVRVLSGMEEGTFGWLTLNMSLKTLNGSTESTVGVIDIGGASVQLTYLPKVSPLNNKHHLDIVDYEFSLYSRSIASLGNDQARKLYEHKLASSGESADPCLPIGENNTISLAGSSDPAKCKEVVKSILPLDVPCHIFDGLECSMLNEHLLTLEQENETFYGIGLFRYVWAFMQLAEDADLQDLEDKTDLICAMNTTELNAYSPNDSYRTEECFAGNFIIQLLTETYKLPKEGTPLIVGDDVDWVPGFFVNEMNDVKLDEVKDEHFNRDVFNPKMSEAEGGTSASSLKIPSWSWIGIALLASYQMFI